LQGLGLFCFLGDVDLFFLGDADFFFLGDADLGLAGASVFFDPDAGVVVVVGVGEVEVVLPLLEGEEEVVTGTCFSTQSKTVSVFWPLALITTSFDAPALVFTRDIPTTPDVPAMFDKISKSGMMTCTSVIIKNKY